MDLMNIKINSEQSVLWLLKHVQAAENWTRLICIAMMYIYCKSLMAVTIPSNSYGIHKDFYVAPCDFLY